MIFNKLKKENKKLIALQKEFRKIKHTLTESEKTAFRSKIYREETRYALEDYYAETKKQDALINALLKEAIRKRKRKRKENMGE